MDEDLFSPDEYYTVRELSEITGIEYTQFYSYREKLRMGKYTLPSGRTGYAIHTIDFEKILEECKTFPFGIQEYEIYKKKKRPIIRQFLDARETFMFMHAVGDQLSIFTVKRQIRENKIPSYVVERKYLVPIVYLIRRYLLPIDDALDQMIAEIIKEPYEFKL